MQRGTRGEDNLWLVRDRWGTTYPMNPDLQIRAAAKGDAELLAELNEPVQALHAEHYPSIFKAETSIAEVARMFADSIQNSSHAIYLAYYDDVPAGYLWYQSIDNVETPIKHAHARLIIHQICVQPRLRRKGIGRALMKKALSDGEGKKVEQIWLNSWVFNAGAHNFFESFGFVTTSINMHLFSPVPQQDARADARHSALTLDRGN